mmetsp:Transcript_22367/g.61090  ORF Transcript_22367/g.61090 Transcript_22367/m.61090 type:complete len:213 (-) Transcript_22367:915-1553(-)
MPPTLTSSWVPSAPSSMQLPTRQLTRRSCWSSCRHARRVIRTTRRSARRQLPSTRPTPRAYWTSSKTLRRRPRRSSAPCASPRQTRSTTTPCSSSPWRTRRMLITRTWATRSLPKPLPRRPRPLPPATLTRRSRTWLTQRAPCRQPTRTACRRRRTTRQRSRHARRSSRSSPRQSRSSRTRRAAPRSRPTRCCRPGLHPAFGRAPTWPTPRC